MKNNSRRDFLKKTAAFGVGTLVIPNFVRCSANSKVNIAVVGVGGRGIRNWTACLNKDNPELNQYVKEPVRKGWEYGEDLWK